MDQLLKNKILDFRLQKDGFTKLNFLHESHIEAITRLYEETKSEHEKVGKKQFFHATQDIGNPDITDFIDKRAKELLEPVVRKHFVNYRIIMANFILKAPGEASILEPHQDWTFVDESKYATYGFWTPIEDTNEKNGNLQFLPGSHKIASTLRVNYNYPCAFSEIKELAKEHLVDIKTKKGESVMLNHAVLHGSRPNLSSKTRVALSLGITHKDAQLMHFFCEDGENVKQYHITVDELARLKYGIPPNNKFLVAEKKVNFPIISEEKFKQWLSLSQKEEYV